MPSFAMRLIRSIVACFPMKVPEYGLSPGACHTMLSAKRSPSVSGIAFREVVQPGSSRDRVGVLWHGVLLTGG